MSYIHFLPKYKRFFYTCLPALSEFNKVLVTWLVPSPLLEKVESIYGFRSCFGNFSGLGIFQVKVLFFSHFIPSADKKKLKLTYIQYSYVMYGLSLSFLASCLDFIVRFSSSLWQSAWRSVFLCFRLPPCLSTLPFSHSLTRLVIIMLWSVFPWLDSTHAIPINAQLLFSFTNLYALLLQYNIFWLVDVPVDDDEQAERQLGCFVLVSVLKDRCNQLLLIYFTLSDKTSMYASSSTMNYYLWSTHFSLCRNIRRKLLLS